MIKAWSRRNTWIMGPWTKMLNSSYNMIYQQKNRTWIFLTSRRGVYRDLTCTNLLVAFNFVLSLVILALLIFSCFINLLILLSSMLLETLYSHYLLSWLPTCQSKSSIMVLDCSFFSPKNVDKYRLSKRSF